MTQTSVYVFSSQTANEAANAVHAGQYESIIQYHVNKYMQHQQQQGPMTQHPLPPTQQQQKQQNHYATQPPRPNLSQGQQQSHPQLLGQSPHSQMQIQPNGPPPPQPPLMQHPPPVNYPQGPPQNQPPHGQWILNHHGVPIDHPQSPHNQHIKYDNQPTMNNQSVNNHVTGPPLQQTRSLPHNFDQSANLLPQVKKETKLNNNGQPPPQFQQQQPPISYQNQNIQPSQWMNHPGPLEHPQSPHQQHMNQIKYDQQPNLNNQIPPNHVGPQIRPNLQQSIFDPNAAQQKKDQKLNSVPPPQQMQQHPPPVPYQNVPQNSQQQWMNHPGVLEHPQSPHPPTMNHIKYEPSMNQMPPSHIVPPPTRPNLQQSQQNFESNLTPQQKKERDSKLTKLGHLANVISMNSSAQCGPIQTNMTQHQMSQPPQHQLQTQHQIMTQPQHMQQAPTQPPLSMKQDHQGLDPLSSMAAMSESPNMYGHTIHHHPHRQQHPTN